MIPPVLELYDKILEMLENGYSWLKNRLLLYV